MKRCSPVLNTVNGVAVGEATLPIWVDHSKTLLNRPALSAPELEHVQRPTYAVNEESPSESEVLVIQKMKNGKSGGDDGISADREMTKIIRSIWIDERTPNSWRHAIIIPLHKKSRTLGIIEESLCCVLCTTYWSALSWTNSLNIVKKQRATSKQAFVLVDLPLTRCSSSGG
ncbi:hypothetical protein RB195_011292 [Necator americanus]|uniref:Uncharacterized protein n=1 Tax=Necator americanus TaxID=51031 RepID=A0ABR1D1X5_NECAM